MQRFQLLLGERGRFALTMVGLVAAAASCGGSGTAQPPVTSSGSPTTGSSVGTAGGTTGSTTSGGAASGTPSTGGATTGTSASGMSSGSASRGYPAQTGVCAGAGTRVLTNAPTDAFVDDFEEAT